MDLIRTYGTTSSDSNDSDNSGHGADGGANVGDGGGDAGNGEGESHDTTANDVGGVDGGGTAASVAGALSAASQVSTPARYRSTFIFFNYHTASNPILSPLVAGSTSGATARACLIARAGS